MRVPEQVKQWASTLEEVDFRFPHAGKTIDFGNAASKWVCFGSDYTKVQVWIAQLAGHLNVSMILV